MARFDAENQPRKKRGKSGRTLVLEGIKAAIPSVTDLDTAEKYYWHKIATRAFNPDDKDSATLLKVMADKGFASVKPVMEKVLFDLDNESTPLEQAKQVLKAVSEGDLSPDVGNMLIGSVTSLVKIDEVTEIRKELEELKKAIDEQSAS